MSWLISTERVLTDHGREGNEVLLHDRFNRCSNRCCRECNISQDVQCDPVTVRNALRFQISAETSWIRTLRIVSGSGMHRRSGRCESSTESAVSEKIIMTMEDVSYKIPHDLARHISPSDQDAS
jgi:hypothetical protein